MMEIGDLELRSGFHDDVNSGLPNRDHALSRIMLAMVKLIREIGDESSEKNR
jgi:hypothetical protein